MTTEQQQIVMRWRCGWCGLPTDSSGNNLPASEFGLVKNIDRDWAYAKLVNGACCENNPVRIGHAAISEDLGA